MRLTIAVVAVIGCSAPVGCTEAQKPQQVQQNAETTALLDRTNAAFFDLLPQNDFAAEHGFMGKKLAAAMNLGDWTEARQKFLDLVGETPRYTPYQTTFYPRDSLFAAVDFSGRATRRDVIVCGYVVWEISGPDKIALVRLEQNIVDLDILGDKPIQELAQLMADWRCPVPVIQDAWARVAQRDAAPATKP